MVIRTEHLQVSELSSYTLPISRRLSTPTPVPPPPLPGPTHADASHKVLSLRSLKKCCGRDLSTPVPAPRGSSESRGGRSAAAEVRQESSRRGCAGCGRCAGCDCGCCAGCAGGEYSGGCSGQSGYRCWYEKQAATASMLQLLTAPEGFCGFLSQGNTRCRSF